MPSNGLVSRAAGVHPVTPGIVLAHAANEGVAPSPFRVGRDRGTRNGATPASNRDGPDDGARSSAARIPGLSVDPLPPITGMPVFYAAPSIIPRYTLRPT